MKYQARATDMPIANAESMVEWLNECTVKVKHRPLDEILKDIEKDRPGGVYGAGETVRFNSERAYQRFKVLFC